MKAFIFRLPLVHPYYREFLKMKVASQWTGGVEAARKGSEYNQEISASLPLDLRNIYQKLWSLAERA